MVYRYITKDRFSVGLVFPSLVLRDRDVQSQNCLPWRMAQSSEFTGHGYIYVSEIIGPFVKQEIFMSLEHRSW